MRVPTDAGGAERKPNGLDFAFQFLPRQLCSFDLVASAVRKACAAGGQLQPFLGPQ
jgi:hypothetical protein